MTVSARNWAWTLELKSGQKVVLLYLAEMENAVYGYAFPSQEDIAHKTGLSPRAVREQLVTLGRADGPVRIEKTRPAHKTWAQSRYFLKVPETFRATDQEWLRARRQAG